MNETPNTRSTVMAYYGQTLKTSKDLKTDACCTPGDLPASVRDLLADIHAAVSSRYYGCGLVLPPVLEGMRILDIGCGAGRDCYLLSKLVGPSGSVVGVDMTREQLAVAREYIDYHTQLFGYAQPNVEFIEGDIEQLDALDLAADSFDIVVSNCVINLTDDKEGVFRAVHRLLKPGGELYFSDVYADRRLPEALRADPVLLGECLAGALYWNDFETIARRGGFADPRLVEDRPLAIGDAGIRERIAPARFYSATYRLIKIEGLEPACEDYGQAVRYRGGVEGMPEAFVLDKHHRIETGRVLPVCGNTYRMLHETRFASHFDFYGDWERHYGIFDGCGARMPFNDEKPRDDQSGCC